MVRSAPRAVGAGVRRQSHRAHHPLPSRRRRMRVARRVHECRRRRPDRHQALAPDARRLSLRNVIVAASDAELIDAFCDQLWLRTAWHPPRSRATAAISRRGRRGSASAGLLTADRGDVEAWLADQFRAKAKATSVARRLSALKRFYRLQLERLLMREDPTLRVRAPRKPRRLPKLLVGDAGGSAAGRARRRHDAWPARPRLARNALRHGPARLRARRTQDRAGLARRRRRARARQGQQGAPGAARRRGRVLDRALSQDGAAGARRQREKRITSSSPPATGR